MGAGAVDGLAGTSASTTTGDAETPYMFHCHVLGHLPAGVPRQLTCDPLPRRAAGALLAGRDPFRVLLRDQAFDPIGQQRTPVDGAGIGTRAPEERYFSCFKASHVERYVIQFC